jgi:hypothetical protein
MKKGEIDIIEWIDLSFNFSFSPTCCYFEVTKLTHSYALEKLVSLYPYSSWSSHTFKMVQADSSPFRFQPTKYSSKYLGDGVKFSGVKSSIIQTNKIFSDNYRILYILLRTSSGKFFLKVCGQKFHVYPP